MTQLSDAAKTTDSPVPMPTGDSDHARGGTRIRTAPRSSSSTDESSAVQRRLPDAPTLDLDEAAVDSAALRLAELASATPFCEHPVADHPGCAGCMAELAAVVLAGWPTSNREARANARHGDAHSGTVKHRDTEPGPSTSWERGEEQRLEDHTEPLSREEDAGKTLGRGQTGPDASRVAAPRPGDGTATPAPPLSHPAAEALPSWVGVDEARIELAREYVESRDDACSDLLAPLLKALDEARASCPPPLSGSPATDWSRHMRSLLGQQVAVTLQDEPREIVLTGQLLSFDEAGQVVLRDETGFLHWGWPNLDTQPLTEPGTGEVAAR